MTTNNNCAGPFERNTTKWSKPMRNVLSVFFKEHHIYQGSINHGGGDIDAIMYAMDVSDIKNKADDTVTWNKCHINVSEDATQSLSEIRHCALDCGIRICGFG